MITHKIFNKDSGLVKLWVRLLTKENSKYIIYDIPSISNLRDIVLLEISDIKQFKYYFILINGGEKYGL